MPINKDELVASVKSQLTLWSKDAYPYQYNTGYTGRLFGAPPDYSKTQDIVTAKDFNAAYDELKEHVKQFYAGYELSKARSGSGGIHNVWDLICAQYDNSKPRKMNYHIKVDGTV